MYTVENFQFIAAPFTPFDQDSEVRFDLIPGYYRHLREQGVHGAFVCGTTGEGPSLTISERLRLTEAWVEARGGQTDFRIFVHAGHECIREAREIARHAGRIGVDAVSALAPAFFTPETVDEAVDHAARVADAADGLPFYYYHLPSMTGMNLSMVRFLELARKLIPNLAGLKFTHSDLGEYHDCLVTFGGELEILFGRDELLLEALAVGAPGAVGSTYNFMASVYQTLLAAFESLDLALAAEKQALARRVIDHALAHGGLAGLKGALSVIWQDCGPCRPPLPVLSEQGMQTLAHDLERLNLTPRNQGTTGSR